MKNYNLSEIKNKLSSVDQMIVLFGAGDIGELSSYALTKLGLKVNYFCDNDTDKHGTERFGIKVLSFEELIKLKKDTNIFISNNYYSTISVELKSHGFTNFYDCVELLNKTDFTDKQFESLHTLKIDRRIEYYKNMCLKDEYNASRALHIKNLDVQITERCSLKCTNCSNLMQFYEKPVNEDLDLLFSSLDRFMDSINEIDEFRVLGGDPFMNKDMHKVVNKLVSYEKAGKVIVYTNGKIIPKGPNLECLKNEKVILDMTNYGIVSNNAQAIIKVCEDNNIKYSESVTTVWQDCGEILPFQKRTEEEKKRKFIDSCNSDTLSLLKGKLYRCPFSANAENLNAVPKNKEDQVDLSDPKVTTADLKVKIKNVVYDKEYISACDFCNGRDYTVKKIKAAVQTKKPLPYVRV